MISYIIIDKILIFMYQRIPTLPKRWDSIVRFIEVKALSAPLIKDFISLHAFSKAWHQKSRDGVVVEEGEPAVGKPTQ